MADAFNLFNRQTATNYRQLPGPQLPGGEPQPGSGRERRQLVHPFLPGSPRDPSGCPVRVVNVLDVRRRKMRGREQSAPAFRCRPRRGRSPEIGDPTHALRWWRRCCWPWLRPERPSVKRGPSHPRPLQAGTAFPSSVDVVNVDVVVLDRQGQPRRGPHPGRLHRPGGRPAPDRLPLSKRSTSASPRHRAARAAAHLHQRDRSRPGRPLVRDRLRRRGTSRPTPLSRARKAIIAFLDRGLARRRIRS